MKNVITNSDIDNSNGNLSIGDKTINLFNLTSYRELSKTIESKILEQKALNEKLISLDEKRIKNGENEYLDELIHEKGLSLVSIGGELNSLFEEKDQIVKSLISFLNIALDSDINYNDSGRIRDLIANGDLDLLSDRINEEGLMSRRELIRESSKMYDIELSRISNSFLLKARATLFDSNDFDRNERAYELFKKSIDTKESVQNLLEFSDFLEDFRVEETILINLKLVAQYSQSLTAVEIANLMSKIAFGYTHEREFQNAVMYYQKAIDYYIQENDRNPIKDLNILSKIAKLNLSISFCHFPDKKNFDIEESSLNKAKSILEDLIKADDKYLDEYSEYLHANIQFCLVRGQFNDNVINSIEKHRRIQNYLPENEKNPREHDVAHILIILATFQIEFGDNFNAYKNLKQAERYIISIKNLYTKDNVNLLGILYSKLSHLYEETDLEKAEHCMRNAIQFFKMRINVNPREAKDLIANYLIELSSIHEKMKNSELYLQDKQEALNLFKELYLKNPNRNVEMIIGTIAKLNLTFLTVELRDEETAYIKSLISFLEYLIEKNPTNVSLKVILCKCKNTFALMNRIFFKDDNKSRELLIEILEELERIDDVDIKQSTLDFTLGELVGLGVSDIVLSGKKARIGPKNQSL